MGPRPMVDAVVVGAGNIGATTALYLFEKGYTVIVVDRDPGRVRRIREQLGLQAIKASVGDGDYVKLVARSRLVALALPGNIGYEALKTTIIAGAENVVDVSFMPEDPLTLNRLAKEKGSRVVVDAGLAPGISNLFIGRAFSQLERIDEALVYVGGVAEDPECPLGLAGTWNTRDLLEEYVRPARRVVEGEIRSVDPLSEYGEIHVPGVGVFEYFPSDGLRTMLKTIKPLPRSMAEYTLRWPGHVETMRMLRRLGFLDPIGLRIGLCEIDVIDYTSTVLANKLVECRRDRVVMYVDVTGIRGGRREGYELVIDQSYDGENQVTAMAKTTSTMQSCICQQLLEETINIEPGVNPPEIIGMDNTSYNNILQCVRGKLNLTAYKKIEEQPAHT